MSRPNDLLAPLHFAIEFAVARQLAEHRRLVDKDIEWIYEQYRTYFQAVRQGKDPAEPDSTRADRSAVMDYIWEVLVKFENGGGPQEILDEGIMAGHRRVDSAEELYVMAFRDLRDSCRTRRKMDGQRGYVIFVRGFVAEHLAQDPDIEDLYDPEVALGVSPGLARFEEKRGYSLVSASPVDSGIAEIDKIVNTEGAANEESLRQLLVKYPDNRFLLEELSFVLDPDTQRDEIIDIAQDLSNRFTESARLTAQYLYFFIFEEDPSVLANAAKRLNFRHDLKTYPPLSDGNYSLLTQHYHATVSVALKLHADERAYALELVEDLLDADVPEALLGEAARLLALDTAVRYAGKVGKSEQLEEERLAFPLVIEMVGEVLEEMGRA